MEGHGSVEAKILPQIAVESVVLHNVGVNHFEHVILVQRLLGLQQAAGARASDEVHIKLFLCDPLIGLAD
jgi:hypothetical protein